MAEQLRQQQGQEGLQRRNGLRAGQTRLANGVGEIEGEQLRQEQKEATTLVVNCRPLASAN
jgi:hypothetical protein